MAAALVAESQETLGETAGYSASIISHEKEGILADGLGVEGSIDHASRRGRYCGCSLRALEGRRKGKEARKGEA